MDAQDESGQGDRPQDRSQEADRRDVELADTSAPATGAGGADAQPTQGPVEDRQGEGGVTDQGPMTQPVDSDRAAAATETGAAGATPGGGPGDGEVALLGSADEDRFRQRWSDVQARFVDDPQEAVRSADGLVAELMQSLAQGFSEHKERLESQWQRGGDPDTEELRRALQRYRSFFDRLLST
jgi:hypothetical protein